MQLLMTISDSWYNDSNEQHLVVTGTTDRTIHFADGCLMELRLPDGKNLQLPARAVFLDPSPKNKITVAFKGLRKEDVPIGSEVWMLEPEAKPRQPLKKFPGAST